MSKRKRRLTSKATNNRVAETPSRKNLPLLVFEEFANGVFQESVAALPFGFTREDFVRELRTYLEYSSKQIQLTGRFKVKAIDIGRYYDPQKHPGLLEQADFKKWAEPLLTDDNLRMLDSPMQSLRKRAGELSIDWPTAALVLRRVSDKFLPDQRSQAIKRGEFCEQIIAELKRTRETKSQFRTFEDLERLYPNYEVLRILKHPRFDSQDRDLLVSPFPGTTSR